MATDKRNVIVDAVEHYRHARQVADEANGTKAAAQQKAVTTMQKANTKSISYEADEVAVKASMVQGSSLVYNEPALRKALGAKVWNKITRAHLDTKLLEAAIAAGEIDPVIVAQHTTVKDNAPFIRLTERTKE